MHERTENRMHRDRRYSDDYNDGEMELYSQYKDQNMVIHWQDPSNYFLNQSIFLNNTVMHYATCFCTSFVAMGQ